MSNSLYDRDFYAWANEQAACICSPCRYGHRLAAGQRNIAERETDCIERANSAPPGSLHHRSDIGVQVRAPLGTEAVGHLAEDHARPQRLLGAVVGGRHRSEED